ncbi:MAG: chalcone isomerase family protein [Myxococcota bacterium]|nr:chalcone isomerase family protein [Myxococcota bacterium]
MKKIAILAISTILLTPSAYAREVKGANIPETLKAGSETLVLNGTGVRSKFFISVYVGCLYLKQKASDAKKIIAADEAMAVRLHIVSNLITPEKMEKITREGFEKSTGGKTAPIKTHIDNFVSTFKDGIKSDDVYDLIYTPGQGTKVYKNGKLKTSAAGLAFKKALFGIWLGSDPVQNSLKKGMLGS